MMSKARAYDLAAAAPIILLLGFGCRGIYMDILRETASQAFSLPLALWVCAKALTTIFIAMQIVLFAARRLPVAKSSGWLPRIVAVIGSLSATLFLALPSAPPSAWLNALSSLFTMAGTAGAIVAIGYLGRSFSITPQARVLATQGPYRYVRHPLYLAEQVGFFGVMLLYRQPWALCVFGLCVLLQIPRIHFEEEVLAKAFPAYRDYAAAVRWRFIPGVY
jgi:protein-S-isoprenylcysteine O-methyltransferase Ste14